MNTSPGMAMKNSVWLLQIATSFPMRLAQTAFQEQGPVKVLQAKMYILNSMYRVLCVQIVGKHVFVVLLDLQCWIPGNCQGILIDEVEAVDESTCLNLCKANDSCLWFSHNVADDACVLLEDCQNFDVNCVNCLSGQKQCLPQKEGKIIFPSVLVSTVMKLSFKEVLLCSKTEN